MSIDLSCVIVGAGMAGLTAAGVLQAKDWKVVVVDKGRGCGGRMATRRMGDSRLDHGAQFFTVRDGRFAEAVKQWQQQGWVMPWFSNEFGKTFSDEAGGDEHVRYRSAGGMNALAKHLAAAFDVRLETKVASLEKLGKGWRLLCETGESFEADALLLTPPAPQTMSLLAGLTDAFDYSLKSIDFDPCFALLVTLDGASGVPAPGYVRPESGPIEWIADNTQKGVSTGVGALTIHSRAEFSRKYLEAPQDQVAQLLMEAARPWFGESSVVEWQLHRWRYSKPVKAAQRPICLFTQQPAPLAIAGDAFAGGRVEGAFLSGLAAAESFVEFRG